GGRRPLVRHFGDRVEHERVRGMIQAAIFGGGAAAAPVKIGRFTVLDRLGQGGMGVVYAAYDDRLERKVAVKVLRSGAADPGEAARTRLLREAQAMARLAHPNIVSVHEVGDHDGQVFVAMEYVKGQSLDAWIQRAPPRPWREVIAVLRQAGRGLAAAHDAGIIHRDFKPHNALLGEDGVVKVLDFGLARASDRALAAPEDDRAAPPSGLLDASLTRTGAVMGTPAYMSPEQHTGIRVDARSDQFSFSVALYEALYGQLPFDCASLPALMTAVLDGAIRPPPPGVKVPGWVHAVVTRGLAVAPEDRFPSMGALLDALDRDPAARRRRWLVGVGLAGLVAASSVSLAALQTTRPCEGVARELDDVWSDARREAVTAGLLAGEELHAQDTSARAAAGLDAYAAAWLDARARACEAHADGRQSDALYDLRVTCLERRRASLDATASILADADATAREQAATAVQHLPSLARCADVEALQATLAPPEDPTLVDDVARAGERLATGRAHEETGRYAQALAIADEVLASPAADAYEPLRAEATLARGRALLLARRPEEAEATLNDALWSALGVGQDELAAEALARRVYVRGELAREGARVLDDAPLGRALLRRSHAEPRLRWLFENNLAVAEDRAGHGALAQAGYERALAALGDAGGVEEAATRANLAMYLQERFQLHEATEQLERALSIASAALGPEHPQISQYQWALADNLARRGQFARPVALLQQTIARGHALLDPGSLAFHLDALAKLELERRAYEDAAAHASRALELITEAFGGDNPLRAEYLADLGEAEVGRGRVDDGLA
ncbi:MAG: serine/threonine protein kinase, partial [Myxococcales bacterium]|nr:serine/threonine protein kinase [Myxococcales bacterium]